MQTQANLLDDGPRCDPFRVWRSAHDMLATGIDPLGIVTPLIHAQLAWWMHPMELANNLTERSCDVAALATHTWRRMLGLPSDDPVLPHADDQRFVDDIWVDSALWDCAKEWYLLMTHHVQDALYKTPGLADKERRRAAFWWRKWLNAMAPTNCFWTNPVAMRKAVETGGASLVQGMQNFFDDMQSGTLRMTDPEDFQVGKNIATMPGAVVYRNHILEVIHYTPAKPVVRKLPIVIVTPWINKFYVLDLSPKKSMVRYLLEQGFSVFITSWKNPGSEMRDTPFDAYISDGIAKMIEVAQNITDSPRVHAIGYCIGGTALAMYMAWANKHYETAEHVPVAHWTLLASLVDFNSPGDVEVFVDEGSVRWLTQAMAQKGYFDGSSMAWSFRLLRSNSLIWQYVVHGWLYGEAPRPFDVLYWNMDTTRMPYAMHAWYLRELYLHNRLVQRDALTVAGESLDLERIQQPLYGASAEDDHITPWKQTFRIHNFVKAPKRFVLSSSGHILGIVNPPVDPPKRSYRVADTHRADSAEDWLNRAVNQQNSWWEDWMAWLKPKCGEEVPAPPAANERFPKLADAPGEYVFET